MKDHQQTFKQPDSFILNQVSESSFWQNKHSLPITIKLNKKNLKEGFTEDQREDSKISYFYAFFFPKETALSLRRRNQNLQMLNFQNSDQQPDDVFNRRKKKAEDLICKEEQQLSLILQIQKENLFKFQAIIQFIKFFCELQDQKLGRTDYYSSKTFCALKNSSESELILLTKVVKKMFNNIVKQSNFKDTNSQSTSCGSKGINQRKQEFLILPRFLISKQKIIRLCKDEALQKNFEFLIFKECLGHYSNEANKKMPEEDQMVYVKQLIGKRLGRQKFKKICSINHGNKFFKTHGKVYFQLYSKSLQYLKNLEICLKKGKKFESIKKDLQKYPSEVQQILENSNNQNQSSSNSNSTYNLKNLGQSLNKMNLSEQEESYKSEMMDEFCEIDKIQHTKRQMKKKGPTRLLSMPITVIDPQISEIQSPKQRKFFVRKTQTLQVKKAENIILVSPPSFVQF